MRYVAPNESAATKAPCLHDQGFPDASATPDGNLASGVIPPGQDEAYAIASYVCAAKYQIDPKYTQPLTTDQLGTLYDYYVSSLIPCLKAANYAIADPPSKGKFVDSYRQTAWNPYSYVTDYSQTEWYKLRAECPQWPSGFYGY